MAEAKRDILIACPLEHVFSVITDFDHYAQFLSGVVSVTSKLVQDHVWDVTYRIRVFKEIEYTLRMKAMAPDRVEWTLVKGDFMKANEGEWTLVAQGANNTLATYRVSLQLNALVPASITKQLAEASLPKMMGDFKARAESTWQA